MLQAKELRTGNIVSIAGSGSRVAVLNINDTGVDRVALLCSKAKVSFVEEIKFKFIAPILLTPEILEKAGFMWNETIQSWINDKLADGPEFIKNNRETYLWQRSTGMQKEVHFLHELQNLYFAVHGEELQVTL